MLTLPAKTLALMNLGLSILQMREIRNGDDLTPILLTGDCSHQSYLPHWPCSFLPVSEVWPQCRPEGKWLQTWAPLKSNAVLQLQMSAHAPGRLLHLETRRKQPRQSQIKLQDKAQSEWLVQLPSGVSAAIVLWSMVGLCNSRRHVETLIVRCLQD